MSAHKQHQETHEFETSDGHKYYEEIVSSYLGLSFTIFLAFLPDNFVSLFSTLQKKNKALAFKLAQAEEQLSELHSRRKEDSKANARVVEIFASHRHAWQQEEKRLFQQIDESGEEIAFLKGKIEDLERVEAELSANVEDLKREVCERDEMLNFMSRSDFGAEECFVGGGMDEIGAVYGQSNVGFTSDFLNSGASKFWSETPSVWQDIQYDSLESVYNLKHFVVRRESPWKVDGDSSGISSKLKLLEKELLNLEKIGKADPSKAPTQMRKLAKRHQALAEKIDDLCGRMQASGTSEPMNPEFRTQRQKEFLLEAFRLQQRASETNQKLAALQSEMGKSYRGEELEGQVKLATRRSMDSIRNNLKEIQRNLEIWLARIIGDVEGILARDGASRVREYYRNPFVK